MEKDVIDGGAFFEHRPPARLVMLFVQEGKMLFIKKDAAEAILHYFFNIFFHRQ